MIGGRTHSPDPPFFRTPLNRHIGRPLTLELFDEMAFWEAALLQALRICLIVLGVSASAIALSILVLGAEATATTAEAVFSALSGRPGAPSEHWPPTMDSELRFYAALWGAYGIVVLRTAWSLPERLPQTPWLAAVFFAGGVGRVLSRLCVGAPNPFFTLLMGIELPLPVLMVLLWLGSRAQPSRAP